MLPVENIIDGDRVREKNVIFRRILHTCQQAQGSVPEKLIQLVGGVVIVSTCSENQLVSCRQAQSRETACDVQSQDRV